MKRNYRIRVHPAGAALAVAALLFGDSHEVLAAVCALLLHEGAHLLAMILCGIRQCSVELTPFGGMADAAEIRRLKPFGQMITAAAGVACSALAAWFFAELSFQNRFVQKLFTANLSLAVLNCLPVWPLDGARILLALFARHEENVRRILAALAWMLGAAFVALALYGAWHGMLNPTLLLAGPYLCYASRMGMISEKVRRIRNLEQKTNEHQLLPVEWLAVQHDHPEYSFASLLGRFSGNCYHVLCQLNSKGQICRMWTENEMLCYVLKDETFNNQTQVDKGKAL